MKNKSFLIIKNMKMKHKPKSFFFRFFFQFLIVFFSKDPNICSVSPSSQLINIEINHSYTHTQYSDAIWGKMSHKTNIAYSSRCYITSSGDTSSGGHFVRRHFVRRHLVPWTVRLATLRPVDAGFVLKYAAT